MAKKKKKKTRKRAKYIAAILDFEKGYGGQYIHALRTEGFRASYTHSPYVGNGAIALSFDTKGELVKAYRAINRHCDEGIDARAMAGQVMINIENGQAFV